MRGARLQQGLTSHGNDNRDAIFPLMKVLKIENLVVVFYVAIFASSVVLLDPNQRRTGDIFLGLLSLSIYVFSFRVWHRIAPRSSRIFLALHAAVVVLLLIPVRASLAAGIILPIPLLFAAIYCAQRERGKALIDWLAANKFTHVPQVSPALLEKLGDRNHWICYANTMALADGRQVPYVFWQGEMEGRTTINGRPTKVREPLIAFSFAQQDVGENVIEELEQIEQDKLSWFQRLRPSNQSNCPYLVDCVSDGSFVVAWGNPHLAAVVEERLAMLRRLLERQPSHPATTSNSI